MTVERPITLIISALGGQGGGILAEWLAEAAHAADFPAQVTSTPGVAQRTGATTYYFELFPERAPAIDPAFSLFPCSGDVDMVAALEPMEAARALSLGYVTERTTVVTARERVYAIGEKILAGDGTADGPAAIEALKRAAGRVLDLDVAAVARAAGCPANAVLFGAIAGCGVLPLTPDHCRAAIETVGVGVAANNAGFAAGWDAARAPLTPAPTPPAPVFDPPPAAFSAAIAAWPAEIRLMAGHALARLVDYQDERYASLYRERLNGIVSADRTGGGPARGFALSRAVAQRLGAWMAFEDVIRVAQLKTRPGRLARIRAEVGAGPDEPVRVIDYLSPGRAELADLLPPLLARLVAPRQTPGPGFSMRLVVSSPVGFALLKLLAALKFGRPWTSRHAREQNSIEHWLIAIKAAAGKGDYDLACRIAGLAAWTRGYGRVRARGETELATALADLPARLAEDAAAVAAQVDASLAAARVAPCVERYPS